MKLKTAIPKNQRHEVAIAYLSQDYDGIGQHVLVSMSRSSVSSAVRARIAAGDFGLGNEFKAGTQVVVYSEHGQLEVLGLGRGAGGGGVGGKAGGGSAGSAGTGAGVVKYPEVVQPSIPLDETIWPTGVASVAALGTPQLINLNKLLPIGIGSEVAIGNHTLVQSGPSTLLIIPTGIASEENFGQHSIFYEQFVQPVGISSDENIGSHSLSGVRLMWSMLKNSTSQTLTNNTDTTITWEAAGVDAGGSVIDLANDRFVIPSDGKYLAIFSWGWESTVPGQYQASVRKNGSHVWLMGRQPASASIQNFGTRDLVVPFEAVAGDLITAVINPGAVTGVTARGNASINLGCTFGLVKL